MTPLIRLQEAIFRPFERLEPLVMPLLARLVFAGVLFQYFWASGLTKLGDGIFGFLSPSTGAYAQIFPKKAEEVLYDVTQFSLFEKTVIFAGTWAEFILPVLLVIGLFGRFAALGMIGFVVVQSLTDIFGHGADAETIGAWFDKASGSLILDQRAFWVFLLLYVAVRGAGALSVDRFLLGRRSAASDLSHEIGGTESVLK